MVQDRSDSMSSKSSDSWSSPDSSLEFPIRRSSEDVSEDGPKYLAPEVGAGEGLDVAGLHRGGDVL